MLYRDITVTKSGVMKISSDVVITYKHEPQLVPLVFQGMYKNKFSHQIQAEEAL